MIVSVTSQQSKSDMPLYAIKEKKSFHKGISYRGHG